LRTTRPETNDIAIALHNVDHGSLDTRRFAQNFLPLRYASRKGLLFLPPIIAGKATYHGVGEGRIPVSAFWLIVSVFISGLFIGILGPGIHFSN
jgi:hypothetical protein